jgi:hypothetical protein
MLTQLRSATGMDPVFDTEGEGSVNEESLMSYLNVTELSGKWKLLKYLYAIQDFRAAGVGKGGHGSAKSAGVSRGRADKLPKSKRAKSTGEPKKRGRPPTNPKTIQKQLAREALARASVFEDSACDSEGTKLTCISLNQLIHNTESVTASDTATVACKCHFCCLCCHPFQMSLSGDKDAPARSSSIMSYHADIDEAEDVDASAADDASGAHSHI